VAQARLSVRKICDLLEILDDRHDRRSTLITSPVEQWQAARGLKIVYDPRYLRFVRSRCARP
jgi:hypothetical protein